MLKYCVVLTLFVNYGFSQTENIETKVNLVTESATEILISPIVIETTPSLEEQGFKAITIENNKIIYRKVVNGIVIELKPEEK